MDPGFAVQIEAVACYRTSADVLRSVLTIGLSDDVHPAVVSYLDDLGNWLGASPRSMEKVRAAVCLHGCATLRRVGLMVGIKPVDTARLLADCSGGVAWLTWAAALLECYTHNDIAWFQQEVGHTVGLKSSVVPHLRELVAALKVTAPRLGTVSFPEYYASTCGAMRQALFAKTELCPPRVAEPPLISDVRELLVKVAESFREQRAIAIRGQQSIGWLAATLGWIYGEAVEIVAAGKVVVAAELRAPHKGLPPLILVELCEDQSAMLTLEYVLNKDTIIATLTTQDRKDTLSSFGPKRSRADEYFTNWLNCTSPVGSYALEPLAEAASHFTCGLLRTVHVTNEGGGGLKAEVQGSGKQLVNILKLPGAYSDVKRVQQFYSVGTGTQPHGAYPAATSQLQLILRSSEDDGDDGRKAAAAAASGGSITALAFLKDVPSLREAYSRMVREMKRVGIRGENDCFCVVPGTGPEADLPSAHEPHCGTYQAASLAVELVAACICSLFIEGPTSPRLTMFHASPLRWAISKAIEQSVLAGSALISGADLMKSILVIAGYSGDYGYGPLITSCSGQALVLAAIDGLTFSPHNVGRVLALPGAVIHRGQYYERVVVGSCRRQGGDVLRTSEGGFRRFDSDGGFKRKRWDEKPTQRPCRPFTIEPSSEGAADSIDIMVRETLTDLELVVRSRQSDGTDKEHDIWHCITAALTANVLGECNHREERGYTTKPGELVTLVGTCTNLNRGILDAGLTVATVGKPVDRLLACGVNVNIVMRTTGCMSCAMAACKQVGYRYLVS